MFSGRDRYRYKVVLILTFGVCLGGCFAGKKSIPVQESTTRSSTTSVVQIVRPGDTLYSIAWSAGLDYRAVARWNRIKPPYLIKPGQVLHLRPGRNTDNLSSISTKTNKTPTKANQTQSSSTSPTSTQRLSSSDWIWPVKGRVIRRFSTNSANPGIDIAGKSGQPVYSAADGRVVYSGDGLRGYGKLIIVKHNEVFLSAYAHNNKLLVSEGVQVRRGEVIAEMGSTEAERVKLHFEIRKNGKAVDPLRYLPKS